MNKLPNNFVKAFVIFCLIGLGVWLYIGFFNAVTNKNEPVTYTKPVPSPTKELTIEDIAVNLVKFDDKDLSNSSDIRVKRATFLLKEITAKTNEKPLDVAVRISAFHKMLVENYGKKIPHQQILEEVKKVLDMDKPMIKNTESAILALIMVHGK